MHDEFLMVVPPEWVELTNAAVVVAEVGEAWLSDVIMNQNWYEIDQILERLGTLAEGQAVAGLRMVNTGEGVIRIWAKYN